MSNPFYQRQRRSKLKAEGLCTKCGRQRDTTQYLVCTSCRTKPYYTYTKEKHIERKLRCFKAYGGSVCACCGQTNHMFLAIDHINNDGASHRKLMWPCMDQQKSRSGGNIYTWLSARKFPPGFQVLCHNCNFGKHLNGGVCPHVTATA